MERRRGRDRRSPAPDAAGLAFAPNAAQVSGPPPTETEDPRAEPPPEGPLGPDPNRQAPPRPAHIDRAVRPPRDEA